MAYYLSRCWLELFISR